MKQLERNLFVFGEKRNLHWKDIISITDVILSTRQSRHSDIVNAAHTCLKHLFGYYASLLFLSLWRWFFKYCWIHPAVIRCNWRDVCICEKLCFSNHFTLIFHISSFLSIFYGRKCFFYWGQIFSFYLYLIATTFCWMHMEYLVGVT